MVPKEIATISGYIFLFKIGLHNCATVAMVTVQLGALKIEPFRQERGGGEKAFQLTRVPGKICASEGLLIHPPSTASKRLLEVLRNSWRFA